MVRALSHVLFFSTLVRCGEYRSQTGIQRKLNFVSVRTIKEGSSSAPNEVGARRGIVPLVDLRRRPPGSVPGKKRESPGLSPRSSREQSHSLSPPPAPLCGAVVPRQGLPSGGTSLGRNLLLLEDQGFARLVERPLQCTPATVYRWLSQGVKVELGRDFQPLTLAPRQVHPSEISFVLADQDKGRRTGAYARFLSRSRVHTTVRRGQIAHGACVVCPERGHCQAPHPLRRCDGLALAPPLGRLSSFGRRRVSLLARANPLGQPQVFLESLCDARLLRRQRLAAADAFAPRRLGWAWQPTEDCLPATSSCRSSPTSLPSPLACPSPPLLAPPLHPQPLHPHTGHWLQIVEFSHAALPFGWTSSPRFGIRVSSPRSRLASGHG